MACSRHKQTSNVYYFYRLNRDKVNSIFLHSEYPKKTAAPQSWVRMTAAKALGEILRVLVAADAARMIQQLQQTGMLFMQTQQTQPALAMPAMQSQHAWIMVQHAASPLVQVMQTPSLVGSHLHMPMARLQQHIIMPFIIMQQLHMPPAIIEQRFCIIVADMASSHLQVIFMPPVHFSIVILHRGTIIH
jgi:hypothetical protein